MKITNKLILFTGILLCSQSHILAQESQSKILKISYTTIPTSEKMVELLKHQIKDPTTYNSYLQLMSEFKIFYSLYINTTSNKSVYKLDSIKQVEHVKIPGYIKSVIKDDNDVFFGEEQFLNSNYTFQGNITELKWSIGIEEKTINGYSCKKATLINSPDVSVWFTSSIPVSIGPEIYNGLPGLVIQVDSYFANSTATKIAYDVTYADFDLLMNDELKIFKDKKNLKISEVILSKQNFTQLMEKQMQQSDDQ